MCWVENRNLRGNDLLCARQSQPRRTSIAHNMLYHWPSNLNLIFALFLKVALIQWIEAGTP